MRIIKFGSESPHWKGGKIKKNCLNCDKEFFVDPNVIKSGKGKYCSRSCVGASPFRKRKTAPKVNRICVICGKEFTEYLSRMKEKNRGTCCSKECRIKHTKKLISGDKNWRWNGGKIPENTLQRSRMAMRNWSFNVKKRDKFTCQKCGDKNYRGRGSSVILHAHHIKSFAKNPDLRLDLNNGITLCYLCHKKEHKKMNIVSKLYKLARISNDIRAIAEPKRAARRIKNKIVGRMLGKLGFWRKIWS